MMMIFNNLGKLVTMRRLLALVLSLFVLPLYADDAVNSMEKNDKIESRQQTASNSRGEQSADASNATVLDKVTANGVKDLELRSEQWEFARNGDALLSLPVLHHLVNTWLADRDMKIEIQYPGGEEGEFWVQELADWLVALGISSENMVLVPGSGIDDVIRFDLIR